MRRGLSTAVRTGEDVEQEQSEEETDEGYAESHENPPARLAAFSPAGAGEPLVAAGRTRERGDGRTGAAERAGLLGNLEVRRLRGHLESIRK